MAANNDTPESPASPAALKGLRVVETNCFHSSGFYRCDVRAVVRAVTAWVARNG